MTEDGRVELTGSTAVVPVPSQCFSHINFLYEH